ncbi:hypothetical protein BH24ACT22_BH24ACT22_14610 [soil metagenome]
MLASLGILLLGGLIFTSFFTPEQASDSSSIERINVPVSASAPEAVEKVAEEQPAQAQQSDQAMAQSEAVAKDKAAEEKAPEEKAAGEKESDKAEASEKKSEDNAAAQAEAKPAAPPPPQDKTTYLTVPKMGLYDNAVYNSSDPTTLDIGAAKLEESGFPWQESANPYISAHRLGWPGTASYYQFYNLPLMAFGDSMYLTDANGTTYTYEVTEIFEVAPSEVWVSEPEVGRDMISLQTCTETFGDYWTMGPNWSTRYVVRGDRVDVSYA